MQSKACFFFYSKSRRIELSNNRSQKCRETQQGCMGESETVLESSARGQSIQGAPAAAPPRSAGPA